MNAEESWHDAISWFEHYASDPAYSWAGPFPDLLRRLRSRESTAGLYAHRWATALVVSRFGEWPDWQVGPKVELLALPGGRVQIRAFEAHGQRMSHLTLLEPVDLSALDALMRFAAGEAGGEGAGRPE